MSHGNRLDATDSSRAEAGREGREPGGGRRPPAPSGSPRALEARRRQCLEDLVRLERRAMRMYDRFAKAGSDPSGGVVDRTLKRIRADHGTAVELLSTRLDADPGSNVAPPGSDAESEGLATDLLVLVELCQREDRWTDLYSEALADPALRNGDRTLLLAMLLPRQRAHVPLIERLFPFA